MSYGNYLKFDDIRPAWIPGAFVVEQDVVAEQLKYLTMWLQTEKASSTLISCQRLLPAPK